MFDHQASDVGRSLALFLLRYVVDADVGSPVYD